MEEERLNRIKKYLGKPLLSITECEKRYGDEEIMPQKLTIEEMQKLAEDRNGKCLSEEYTNNGTKLIWQCGKGHEWKATYNHIRRGQWCPHCSGRRKTIKDMQELAKKKNGECLSKKYTNNRTNLKWRCKHGHEWEAPASRIAQGHWCPYCMGRGKAIQDMQKIAEQHNGKCLSEEYVNNRTKLKWQCEYGHEWETTYGHIHNSCWCPYCAGTMKKNIKDCHKLAKSKNGKVLSTEYINNNTKYLWQCEHKHEWEANYSSIQQGQWCPYCGGTMKKTIEDCHRLAEEKNGKFLSDKYINCKNKLKWQCSEGHIWEAALGNIQQGYWCPKCGNISSSKKQKGYAIEDMQKLAEDRGGECLSEEYVNCGTKLKWKCLEKHIWEATPSSILHKNTWCPYCASKALKTIKDMQELAKQNNGKCLSKKYINANTKLRWQCEFGHTWNATPCGISGGQWCPYCAGNAKKTMRNMHELAEEKNGKCISKKYINSKTNLKWMCKYGHEWEATPNNVKKGHWCPECARVEGGKKTRKYNIGDMQNLAKERRGKCLSNKCITCETKYRWQCEFGHEWEASWGSIHRGSWCPYCAGQIVTLKNMREIAEKKGGRCLSDKYINDRTKLRWECSEGHVWEAVPSNIQGGCWCPYCCGHIKKTIQDMQELAKKNDGKCLSKIYINNNTKLTWQCKYGHCWESTPGNIKQGKWCPYCLYKKELKFREVMEEYFNAKFPKKYPKWLINEAGNKLELDGYSKDLKIAFEYQGGQHFDEKHYFNKKGNFDKIKIHDQIKKELCEKYNVILLCPTEELNENEYEEFIRESLNGGRNESKK